MLCKVGGVETLEYTRSLFTRSTSRYGSNNFIPPRPRKDLFKASLAFWGLPVRNSLPPSSKTCVPSDALKGTYVHNLAPPNLSTMPAVCCPP